jgi:hypothetical protein
MPSVSTTETRGPRSFWRVARDAPRGAQLIVAVATAYVSISTIDVKIGGPPLKFYAVAIALAVWLWSSKPWTRSLTTFRFGIPVLITGVLVPVVWFLLAAWLSHRHDPEQGHGLSDAVQEASRFVYLLLYFPLADRAWLGEGWDRLWRWPALLLCGVTIALWIGYLAGHHYGQSGDFGPFQGAIAVDATGTFRAFLINDVLFLPLFAFLCAVVARDGMTPARLAGLAALLCSLYLSHTRGLWLGVCVILVVLALAALPRDQLRTLRRCAWTLAVVVMIGGLIVSADPDVSHRLVNAVTGHNEFSTAERLAQAPQLLRGFRRHPLLGSGLGATLPDGYTRDASEPWSFELTYLQLLFQLGIVGVLLAMTPIALGLWAGARSLLGAGLEQRPYTFAAVGGLAAFAITVAGNPYLITSVGTFTLAVLLALLDRALVTSGADVPAGAFATGPSLAARIRRVSPRLALVGVAACAGALTLLELTRAHQQLLTAVASGPAGPTNPFGGGGWTAISPSASLRSLHVDRRVAPLLSDQLATDSGVGAPAMIWAFATRHGIVRITPITVIGRELTPGRTTSLGRAPAGPVSYAVARWGPRHTEAAFELSPRDGAVSVRILSLGAQPKLLLAVRSPVIPAPPGDHRDLAVAPVTGREPELFVIDRPRDGVLAVHTLGAASRLRQVNLSFHHHFTSAFSPSHWRLAVGAAQGREADLVLVGTDVTGPGAQLQAHILLGASGYRHYGVQTVIGIRAARLPSLRVLIAVNPIGPLLYLVSPSGRSVNELRFG